MRKLVPAIALSILSVALFAQEKAVPVNPVIGFTSYAYGGIKMMILRSAEKMPEENLSFRPAPAVRSYGEILAHVADAQYLFCSTAVGDANPPISGLTANSKKAEITAALGKAFAYCDKAYGSMTDANSVEKVKMFGQDIPKLGVLLANNMHTMEHYGNLVTYMRMKDIVPPSSEPHTLPSAK